MLIVELSSRGRVGSGGAQMVMVRLIWAELGGVSLGGVV